MQLAHEFESRDVKLNTVAVNLLMQVLGKSGEWQQAMQASPARASHNAVILL